MSGKDALFVEIEKTKEEMRSISPKLSLYVSLAKHLCELEKKLSTETIVKQKSVVQYKH